MRSVIGTSASSSVLSPTSDWPRILMPSVAARSMATTSSPVSVSAVPAVMPAFMNAVPQMGPDVPPIRELTIIPTFFRKVPGFVRSMSSQPSITFSKPRASEYPKSPSPTTESRSPK